MANNKDFKVKNGIKPTAYHEAVGTVVSDTEYYRLDNLKYDNISFSVASQETSPFGISFSPDGTKMYVVGTAGDDLNEYTLSTAWDITTASYVQTLPLAVYEAAPHAISFKPDGTKMFIIGTGSDRVYGFELSTAWDVSTASNTENFSVSGQEITPRSVTFKPDGTKMYVIGTTGDDVNEYTLSTAWSVSTASFVSNFSVVLETGNPFDVQFKPDGTRMYVLGTTGDYIVEYALTTAWDVSTASYTGVSFSLVNEDTGAYGFFLKPDGSKLYAVGSTTDTVLQYSFLLDSRTLDLSTGSVFEITPTSDIQVSLSNPADSGTASGATLLLTGTATPYTISYNDTIAWPGGTAPTSPAIGETDVITFTTRDGGTTYNAALAIDGAQ